MPVWRCILVLSATLLAPVGAAADGSVCSDRDPQRRVFFGDLHVHTALSADAYVLSTRNGPDEAYRFARGDAIPLRAAVPGATRVHQAHLPRPLDFAAVTDHAEYLGSQALCTTPGSPSYDTPTCADYRVGLTTERGIEQISQRLGRLFQEMNGEQVCGPGRAHCLTASAEPWRVTREAAARWNEPCRFTAFVGYEYSWSPAGSKVHRNVIFRSASVPALPVSAVDEPEVLEMWRRLDRECIAAGTGCDALAIPHNSNLSNGRMFALDYGDATTPEAQAGIARLRARIEPLVEMFQMKGDSECRDGLWQVVGASDELCGFEKYRAWQGATPEDCRDGIGGGAMAGQGCISRLDFARYALAAGLAERRRIGVNPYRLGFVASTDAHDGSMGDVDEWIHDGVQRPVRTMQFGRDNPGGVAAVWAEENTREAIFDALRRRETYATSGPRMSVRLFGGWDLAADLCGAADMVDRGYAGGVPMGGELPARPADAATPAFAVSALSDPGTPERPGSPLERVQIVKVWAGEGDALHQRVFDVAGSPGAAGADPATCRLPGPGVSTLCAVWRDPEFDPAQGAAYYARVLEVPTCRYTTRICRSLPPAERPAACGDGSFPELVQERAWTTPIWYAP